MIKPVEPPGTSQPGPRHRVAQHLRRQILSGLHLGRLTPSTRLPSTRAVAAELGVGPRVVARAYRDLVVDGLVDLRPRSGFYVARDNRRHSLAAFARWTIDVLLEAAERGVPPVAFADHLRASLESRRLSAACLECNDDQRYGLAEELRLDYGFTTIQVPLEETVAGSIPAALHDVDLLVTTAFHAAEVRRLGRDLGKPAVAITIRPELRQWMTEALQESDVYFIAADDRFEAKAATMFGDMNGRHRVRVLITDRHDLSDIPEAAPRYVTRRARELLAARGIGSREIRFPRLFSRESRRELLTFIIEANTTRAARH
jgi:DNA-binding transcriptional regulator YhcF (GntR family)